MRADAATLRPVLRHHGGGGVMLLALSLGICFAGVPPAAAQTAGDGPAVEEFSPGFLGMYRKLMLIEDEIRTYAARYRVDFDLARAVCLYESGGNAGLTSVAGAQGYFQVMPATFRELRVSSNIEAGVKYLGQMIERFGREDRAVAAYNGGPNRVSRAGTLPLETLQYVVGVSQYRTVLKQYDSAIRQHASGLRLETVRAGDTWDTLMARLGIPVLELRMHNPFLADRRLRTGQIVAYPARSRADLFRVVDGAVEYRTRIGDNYIKLAFALGLDLEAVRQVNGLWQLEPTPIGMALRLPPEADRREVLRAAFDLPAPDPSRVELLEASARETGDDADVVLVRASAETVPDEPAPAPPPPPRDALVTHRVVRGDTLGGLAERYGSSVADIQRANQMGRRTTVRLGETLQIPTGTTDAPRVITHRVSSGDTLSALAGQYGTTMSAIQAANAMGSRTTIRVDELLEIPVGRGAAGPRIVSHRVVRGDTLADLAARYGSSVSEIQQVNGMGRRTTIRLGEVLRIPARAGTSRGPVAHRVSRGDTLADLAEQYGLTIREIQDANDMGRRTTIRTGEVLQIPVS